MSERTHGPKFYTNCLKVFKFKSAFVVLMKTGLKAPNMSSGQNYFEDHQGTLFPYQQCPVPPPRPDYEGLVGKWKAEEKAGVGKSMPKERLYAGRIVFVQDPPESENPPPAKLAPSSLAETHEEAMPSAGAVCTERNSTVEFARPSSASKKFPHQSAVPASATYGINSQESAAVTGDMKQLPGTNKPQPQPSGPTQPTYEHVGVNGSTGVDPKSKQGKALADALKEIEKADAGAAQLEENEDEDLEATYEKVDALSTPKDIEDTFENVEPPCTPEDLEATFEKV